MSIRTEALVTGYGKQEILHGVSFSALPRGITAIFGPNGSGKSTLLKVLAGAVPAWSGRVMLGDQDLTALAGHQRARLGIATVPQGGRVFPYLTVRENLLMGAYTVKDKHEIRRRLDRVLGEFPELQRRLRQPAGTMSGGQQMLVSLARALMHEPRVLLLDEPSAGLSPALVSQSFKHIKDLSRLDVPIVLVEQNVRQALKIADHVYILVQGEVRFSGTPADLARHPDLVNLYLGVSAGSAAAARAAAGAAGGA